ncbi:DUF6665 family protein [Breoghania sp.]|uniref:DUF6665 family protein n=1 Tax=Breoghania sp. TaxID=2065378 RepID=UPI002AA67C53|nr:DUF6665 family protein [Breoghania sp.]
MSLRPPQRFSNSFDADPLERALDYEVLAEKASTLGRLQKRLEKALVRLEECSADEADAQSTNGPAYAQALAEAGEALWYVVIQRELCGLRVNAAFYRDFRVPRSVILAMGPASASKASQAKTPQEK